MKYSMLYNYITTNYFIKHNINYIEIPFKFDDSFTFSMGTYEKKIMKRGKVVGYKTIRPENSENKLKDLKKKQRDVDEMIIDLFAKNFINNGMNNPITYVNNYLNDIFFIDSVKIKISNILYNIQKTYFILNRFIRKIKYSKLKRYDNNYDLYMNLLTDYNSKYKLEIIENGQVYTFKLTDLISIIKDNITTCDDNYFPTLKIVKNPYTNVPISLHNMYNIYFAIYSSTYITPPIITNYFKCNFDNEMFEIKYQSEIRDIGIYNFYTNAHIDDIYHELESIFSICKLIDSSFIVDKLYPKTELIDIFRPFIKNFLYARYSHNLTRVSYETDILSKKLYGFITYNPSFGRSYIKLGDKYVSFHKCNTKYIKYCDININDVTYTNQKIHRKINILRQLEGYSVNSVYYMNIDDISIDRSNVSDDDDDDDDDRNISDKDSDNEDSDDEDLDDEDLDDEDLDDEDLDDNDRNDSDSDDEDLDDNDRNDSDSDDE
jgi:hypothetical protein